ncbi:MAG: aminotransferase class III-fold pyridoxal phosphate-dependent enzyme [Planctomycetes bacterium]|nr:aminotransferase class III-fold pyridoxal phosphate-dependent enzyme [Planctomycetota bacterium]
MASARPDDGWPRRASRVLGIGIEPFGRDDHGEPLVAERCEGACLVTTDGRRFVDWLMGFGSALLGYRHPEVEDAIEEQLGRGALMSLPHRLEVEVAERLVAMIPCATKVAFGKNGSDVTTAAVRVARAVTGRDGVLTCGYHGFHDWFAASNATAQGIPAPLRSLVHPVPYDDLPTLRAVLAEHGSRIAALVMEPTRTALPSPGYLAGVRALTREYGVVLVFDEMVTGFRLARGGAQQHFGVTPDLACVGKALSNGLPLAALVGPAEWIDVVPRVAYGMTARGEPLAFAAARATLAVHARIDVADHVRRIGEALRDGFTALAVRHGVDARLGGPAAILTLVAPEPFRERFLAGCRARLVLTNGHLLPSLAHGEAELEATLAVFDVAMRAATS